MNNLNHLFNPQSIAIVGASEEAGKVGNVIAKNILTLGYAGEVFLVNPKHETLFGKKCYQNLNEIESEIDLAVISIPAKFVNDVIRESAGKVKNYVVISAGFAEINEEGRAREEELRQLAEQYNLNILGPNCLGFLIPRLKINASFAGGVPEAGNVAFVSQSGALAVALMDAAEKEGLKFSSVISIGNKMQLDETEILEYLDRDENTKIIGLYLEGIKEGREFVKVASKIKKPIVVLKAGKTERTQRAISSHTGALAGSDEIMRAVFAKVGIMRAENLDEFLSLLQLISLTEAPKNDEVIIITNAGGLGVLTTDAFGNKKIKLAEIGEKMKTGLGKFLPEESSLANPIDVLGDADEKRYAQTLKILKKEKAASVICLLTPQDQTPVKKIAQKIIKFKESLPAGEDKNVIVVFTGGQKVEKAGEKLKENKIPAFFLPEQAVNALDKYYQWGMTHLETKSPSDCQINSERRDKIMEIIQKVKAENRRVLLFPEAKKIAEMYGIPTVDFWDEESAINVEFPVAVKVDSDKVLHKTDKQGLILNVQNQDELQAAIEKIKNNFPGERLVIQPMLANKTELILGIKKDSIFGPVIIYGLGGIYTEIFKLVDFLIPPLSLEEIKNALKGGKLKFLFEETRGQKPYNLDELAKIIFSLNEMAREISEIEELDVNPLLIYNNNAQAVAVDVKIVI